MANGIPSPPPGAAIIPLLQAIRTAVMALAPTIGTTANTLSIVQFIQGVVGEWQTNGVPCEQGTGGGGPVEVQGMSAEDWNRLRQTMLWFQGPPRSWYVDLQNLVTQAGAAFPRLGSLLDATRGFDLHSYTNRQPSQYDAPPNHPPRMATLDAYLDTILDLLKPRFAITWHPVVTMARTGSLAMPLGMRFLSVEFVGIPDHFGHSVAQPYYYYDLGWYSFGIDDSYMESRKFHFARSVLEVPPGANRFRWEMIPGPTTWQYRWGT